MKKHILIILCLALAAAPLSSSAKEKKQKKEPVYNEQGQIIKTGLNYGPLPAVAYDADKGFQLGAILNIYQYGDGSEYPNYFNRSYFEASYFTKGSMLFQLQHDNKKLIPGVRWSSSAAFNIDKAFDFYGFNGYQSFYDYDRMEAWDKKAEAPAYAETVARMDEPASYLDYSYRYNPFYRFNKKTLYVKTDFTGKIAGKLYWEAGYHFRWYNQDAIDRASINKKKNWYDTFPSGPDSFAGAKQEEMRGCTDDRGYVPTLFEQYLTWGLIPQHEVYDRKGRANMFDSSLRLGLMYDSRDKEGAPTRGIWAEGHVILAPKWLGSSNSYYRYAMTFRHYVPIVDRDRLTLAYRLSYEGTFGNYVPYYALPYSTVVGNDGDKDGFGGYRTTRGILRTRVTGLDQMLWTAELRYKFVEFKLWKQNIAFSLTAFTDGSMATRSMDMSYRGTASGELPGASDALNFIAYKNYMEGRYSDLPEDMQKKHYKTIGEGETAVHTLKEMPHATFGLGLRFIMNTNFIVAFEYGMPFSRFYKTTSPYYKQDGNGAFYINLGYLF